MYIVRCADGTLYTGYARDPYARADAHNRGRGAKYTAGRLPVVVVYVKRCRSKSAALKHEYRVVTVDLPGHGACGSRSRAKASHA